VHLALVLIGVGGSVAITAVVAGEPLQTSSSPSNSRAMSTVGNLDDNMGGFPGTDGPNLNLAER